MEPSVAPAGPRAWSERERLPGGGGGLTQVSKAKQDGEGAAAGSSCSRRSRRLLPGGGEEDASLPGRGDRVGLEGTLEEAAGAATRSGRTQPPPPGEAASAPRRSSPAGPQRVDSCRDFWPLLRPGGHPEAGTGTGKAEQGPQGRPWATRPPGAPASDPQDPGPGRRLAARPAGGADSATWWPRAGRNPNHRGSPAIQGDPGPAQASGPPPLTAGVPRGPWPPRVGSQTPPVVLGLPLHQTPAA